ncbi:hypothetical protein J6590_011686 [Homalodisca vitripennis]|nr:hypothetical protein J6590_011686 [Homalodisca vitripennis]
MAVLKAEHNASVKQAVPPTPIKQNDNRPQPHHVRTCLLVGEAALAANITTYLYVVQLSRVTACV